MSDDSKPGAGGGNPFPDANDEELDLEFIDDDEAPPPAPTPLPSFLMPELETTKHKELPTDADSLTDDLDIVFVDDDEEDEPPTAPAPEPEPEPVLEPQPEESDDDDLELELVLDEEVEEEELLLEEEADPSAIDAALAPPPPPADIASETYTPRSALEVADRLEQLLADIEAQESPSDASDDGAKAGDDEDVFDVDNPPPPPPPPPTPTEFAAPQSSDLEPEPELQEAPEPQQEAEPETETDADADAPAETVSEADTANALAAPSSPDEVDAKRPVARARPIERRVVKARPKTPAAKEPAPAKKAAAKPIVRRTAKAVPSKPPATPPLAPAKPKIVPVRATAKAIPTVKPAAKTVSKTPPAEPPAAKAPSTAGPSLRTASGDAARPIPRRAGKTARELMAEALKAHEAGKLEEAAGIYGQILAMDPDHGGAWINLGVLNRRMGRFETAVTCLKRGVRLQPEDGAAWSNLGNALRAVNRLDDAIAAHEQALELTPEQARVHYNAGLALRDTGDLDGAIHAMRRADLLGYKPPDLKWDLALTHLMAGELETGFDGYEARWKLPDSALRHQDIAAWDGTPLDGKTLLVWSEQGLGDTLHFCRYLTNGASGITKDSGKIILEVQPPLARLLKESSAMAGVEIVARSPKSPEADLQVPLLSLPRLLNTSLETIPDSVPYISAPAQPSTLTRHKNNGRMKVGLCWAGKPTHKNDRNRTIELERFQSLLDLPGIDFYSFQKGPAVEEITQTGLGALIKDLGRGFRDFGDTAAALRDVDLMISVDTSIAHLAGAMDKPAWILVPYAPDWRWMLHRGDSPWYPSMTLFRQSSPGDWDETFERLRRALIRKLRAFEQEQATE